MLLFAVGKKLHRYCNFIDHRPPATIVLISGDGDFSNALSRLRQRGYNVFLVCSNIKVAQVLGNRI